MLVEMADPAVESQRVQIGSASLKIRLAQSETDISRVIEMAVRAFDESSYNGLSYDRNKCLEIGRKALSANSRYAVLLAERENALLGFLVGVIGEHFFSRSLGATVMTWYVAPEHRGSIAAIKLLHAFRNWAKARGAVHLGVHVTSGVHMARSHRLLRRLGFSATGGNYLLHLNK